MPRKKKSIFLRVIFKEKIIKGLYHVIKLEYKYRNQSKQSYLKVSHTFDWYNYTIIQYKIK